MPAVSVVMGTFNQAEYLSVAINSILNQTMQDFEFIIVNDGSTDNTDKVLLDYAKQDKRIKIITQQNQGLATARNNGVTVAKGKYVAFMDSDDASAVNRLETHVTFLQQNSHLSACRVGWDGFLKDYRPDAHGIYRNKYLELSQGPFSGEKIFKSLGAVCCIDRESFVDIGGYRTQTTIIEDLDFTLRYSAKYSWAILDTRSMYFRNTPYDSDSEGLTNSNIMLFAKRHVACYISEWCRERGLSDPVSQNKELQAILDIAPTIPIKDRILIYRDLRYLRRHISLLESMSSRQAKKYLLSLIAKNKMEQFYISVLFRILH